MSDEKLIAKRKKWIEHVTGKAIPGSRTALEDARNHQDGQKKIEEMLGAEREMIRTVFAGNEVVLKNEGVKGFFNKLVGRNDRMRLMDPGHDPMKDFDTWHDLPHVEEIDEADLREIAENYKKIIAVAEELRKNPYYAEPPRPEPPQEPASREERDRYRKAMATYEEDLKTAQRRLAEDLWNPLQREGVIPESFIPDAYSEVKRTFDEANAYYEERLQEHARELGEYGAFMEKFNTAMEIGQGMIKLATSGAGMAGAVGELTKHGDVVKNAEEAKKILGYVEIAMSSTSGIVQGALTQRDAVAVADGINIGLAAGISAAVPAPWNDVINGGIAAGIRSASAGKKFAEGDVQGGIREFAAAITGSLSAIDQSDDKKIETIGKHIGTGLEQLANSGDVVRKIQDGDYQGALSIVVQNVGSCVPPANSDALSWIQTIDETAGELKGDVDAIAEQQKIIGSVVDQEALQKLKEAAAKRQEEDFAAFMHEEDRAFEEALAYGFADPADEDEEAEQAEQKRQDSLMKIVAVHKRNEMMFELSKKIVTGGPALVADLVPGMGLVAAAAQLAFSIGEAIKQAEQLLIWVDNVADARKARTAQMDAMLNRMGLQERQVIVANIRVGIQAVKVAGEATKLAGEAAPVGYAVAAGADLAEAALDVSAKVIEVKEMETAWKTYRKALANPQDRKLAREALRQNPTLAKYAMAWGAVEDGNPIAKEAMRRCGLNERTLAQRETNVGKVVEYLEMIYKDDPVLLRAVPVKDDWYPGEIELGVRSWLKFYRAALEKADPPLAGNLDVSGITGGLAAYEAAGEALTKAIKDAQDENVRIAEENGKAIKAAKAAYEKLRKEHEAKARSAGFEPPKMAAPEQQELIEPEKTEEDREKNRQIRVANALARKKAEDAHLKALKEFDDKLVSAGIEAPRYEAPKLEAYVEPPLSALEDAMAATATAMAALAKLKPRTAAGEPHASFTTYCDALEARLLQARGTFDDLWDEQGWLPGGAPAPGPEPAPEEAPKGAEETV